MLNKHVEGEADLKRKLRKLADHAEELALAAIQDGAKIFERAAKQKVVGGQDGAIGKTIHTIVRGS